MKYRVWVEYAVSAILDIEAVSLEEAKKLAEDAPLPEGEYIDGSFEVREDVTDELNGENE